MREGRDGGVNTGGPFLVGRCHVTESLSSSDRMPVSCSICQQREGGMERVRAHPPRLWGVTPMARASSAARPCDCLSQALRGCSLVSMHAV